jgi:2-C-methyl-D-erythritol 4-phosphate cytidylyltransferase
LTDTPVVSDDGATVSAIPARSKFYVSQTPHTFNIRLLMDVYSSLAEDEKADMTDACKMFVIRDKPVKIVMGEIYNFKITTPFDYAMALAYIRDGFGMHK